jgi:hypothetical protein
MRQSLDHSHQQALDQPPMLRHQLAEPCLTDSLRKAVGGSGGGFG